MTLTWPQGPETLEQHLNRFSKYLHRKKRFDIPNLSVMTYNMYLHYKTDTGVEIEMYEDLGRPLKNKVHLWSLGQMQDVAQFLANKIQVHLGVTAEK
jgi:hypothetical protein